MKNVALAAVFAVCAGFSATAASAQPGSPNTTPGVVSRVNLFRINPGHFDAFWADMRQHLKPVYDEFKRRGIITDYSVATKSTTESADDWDAVVTLSYKNWAALDGIGSRIDSVTLGHYGSAAQRTAAGNARNEHRTVVKSFLAREQTVNPWK